MGEGRRAGQAHVRQGASAVVRGHGACMAVVSGGLLVHGLNARCQRRIMQRDDACLTLSGSAAGRRTRAEGGVPSAGAWPRPCRRPTPPACCVADFEASSEVERAAMDDARRDGMFHPVRRLSLCFCSGADDEVVGSQPPAFHAPLCRQKYGVESQGAMLEIPAVGALSQVNCIKGRQKNGTPSLNSLAESERP